MSAKSIRIRDSYEVKWSEQGRAITDVDLARCEAALTLRFPTAYSTFLRQHNGGVPKPNCFLLNYVVRPEIQVFFSIDAEAEDRNLQIQCLALRSRFQLRDDFLPIARIGNKGYLLLSCISEDNCDLYYWQDVNTGFRWRDPDGDTVQRLYFPVDQLLNKLGPSKNREDLDVHFLRLYWSASLPQAGGKVAQQLVDVGYDINFVLPGSVHPMFAALNAEAFAVAEQLAQLGTHGEHRNRDGVSIVDNLKASLQWWHNRAAENGASTSASKTAARKIAAIESVLSRYE